MFTLDNKVAVVVGGGGGLGEACTLALAAQGAQVIIASRNMAKLQEVAKKGSKIRQEIVPMQVDVTDESSVARFAGQALHKYKTIDILVNAQGLNVKMAANEIDFKKWDSLFATNVRGVMLTCLYFGKIMINQNKGKIINISSVRGIRGTDGGNVTYGATKGAVDMITRMLAAEWAPYNINVNALAPSVVMTEALKKALAPERLQLLLSKTLFKKFASLGDVAAACVFLASDESDYITGHIMYVDGGLTAIG